MMFRTSWDPWDGMVLVPCSSIHTFLMRLTIDVVFLDKILEVQKIVPKLKPGRIASEKDSHMVLELPEGVLEHTDTQKGDRLVFD
jgi:hypothetical protein